MSEQGRRHAAAMWRARRIDLGIEVMLVDTELRTATELGWYLTELAEQGWHLIGPVTATAKGYLATLERKRLPR